MKNVIRENLVAVHRVATGGYHRLTPHNPPERYPEYTGIGCDPSNKVYGAVRETLRVAGLDAGKFGTPHWNPLGDLIEPGMTVFIKPNTVSHENLAGHDLFSVIVHSSVLRPILDYVCIALKGRGRVIVGDSQVIFAQFDPAMERSGIRALLEWYRNQTPIPIECFDLRITRGVRSWMYGRWARKRVEQDPMGYLAVDLGGESYFEGIDPKRLRIAIASHKNMTRYHGKGRHQYVFPKSFLASDAVINIAKLKTHRRTAVTLALKNYMGLPALKDCLPHFITGSVPEGGDQYIHPCRRKEICLWLHDKIQTSPWIPAKFGYAVVKKIIWNTKALVPFPDDIYEAMWAGNDTLWRTLLDLNRIVQYADKEGKLQGTAQRSQFHLLDGIIGGQGDGPLSPEPVQSKVIVAGANAAMVDAVGASLMGFNRDKIPLISKALEDANHPRPICRGSTGDLVINLDNHKLTLKELEGALNLHFAAHPNWRGQIERSETAAISHEAFPNRLAEAS